MEAGRESAAALAGLSSAVELPSVVRGGSGAGYRFCKRGMDLVLSSAALAALAPLLALVAALVWCEDRGPVLYRQLRVGEGGRLFLFLKFRSMVRDADALLEQLQDRNEADGPLFKMRQDPRVTGVGRWMRRYSLDELPQLLHVLRGDMSLVGPRPHLPREVELYTDAQRERLSVQPGLLCLREVLGRSNVDFEQWIELDLLYIRRRSLALDLWILWRAIPAVLKADGAY